MNPASPTPTAQGPHLAADGEAQTVDEAWEQVVTVCEQAWPDEGHSYGSCPTELIVDIINERDEARDDSARLTAENERLKAELELAGECGQLAGLQEAYTKAIEYVKSNETLQPADVTREYQVHFMFQRTQARRALSALTPQAETGKEE